MEDAKKDIQGSLVKEVTRVKDKSETNIRNTRMLYVAKLAKHKYKFKIKYTAAKIMKNAHDVIICSV